MNFNDKKVSVERAIAILAKNGIQVDDAEVAVILDFLYLMSKNYNKPKDKASKP
ncbi:PTS sugar transporter subunit IIBC [Chryseobacterium sp. RP-3-3]|uniref:PTS sugar transporter subunit IIBC n=1 Tax=Chryseobacterium antibioticum TaxID=2728847 RepID=A0A7Y0AQA3_9FLAO|nr:PTS sugar transporter subunit IIBC [Chryseobacterium antibioticum]NML71515.1 PTS sugar transporter subunit IIBC [Chryseobacterium antibioticum]